MPADYTLDTLPQPNSDAVKLLPVAGRRVAVIRFAGSSSDDNMIQHTPCAEQLYRRQAVTGAVHTDLCLLQPALDHPAAAP
jgi:hypothetical protein